MNRVQAILTLDMDNLPANFQEILVHEKELIAQWKEAGFLEHFFLREQKNGAVLIFKDKDEAQVKALVERLPLYAFKESMVYFNLIQQF